MKLLWLTCLSICGFNVEVGSEDIYIRNFIEGYYWRDYTGEIPEDALSAGVNTTDTTAYIGQAVYAPSGIFIPGHIDAKTKTLYCEHGGLEYTATEDVKILCTEHPEDFLWLNAKVKQRTWDIAKDVNSIIGGYDEDSWIISVGRVYDGKEVRVGRICNARNVLDGMYTTRDGKGISHTDFEILFQKRIPINDSNKTININIF